MTCRNIIRNADGTYNIVWFGSYGTYDSKKVTCGPNTIAGPNTIVGKVVDKSALFYNPEDKHDNFSDKQQGVVDSLIQRLSVLRNELWYRMSYGLPLFDKVKSKLIIDAEVLSIIGSHPDVSQIQDFTSQVVDHDYKFSATILSTYGQVSVQI